MSGVVRNRPTRHASLAAMISGLAATAGLPSTPLPQNGPPRGAWNRRKPSNNKYRMPKSRRRARNRMARRSRRINRMRGKS